MAYYFDRLKVFLRGIRIYPYRPLWIGVAGIFFAVLVVGWGVMRYRDALNARSLASPDILVAEKQHLIKKLSVVGVIEPGSILSIVSPFDGSIEKKHFEFGSKVERDQLLLEMNASDLEIKLGDAQASMMKAGRFFHELEEWDRNPEVSRAKRSVIAAQLSFDDARRKVAETGTLLERGIVPKMEYDAAVQQLQTQELQLAAAKEDLAGTLNKGRQETRQIAKLEWDGARKKFDELSAEMRGKSIRAPVSGLVLQIPANGTGAQRPLPIEAGSRLIKGQAILNIANLETLAVIAKVDEIDVNHLQTGQEVEVTGDAFPAFSVQGYLSRISAQSIPGTSSSKAVSFEVTVSIPKLTEEQRRYIRAGMSARLSIIYYQNKNAIVVPATAIHQVEGKSVLWIKDTKSGEWKKMEVVVGDATKSGIEILRGVKEGDRIWVNGTSQPSAMLLLQQQSKNFS